MNILITGGASGIGAAISVKFASDRKNRVYITYNRSLEKAGRLQAGFPNLTALKCDFTAPGETEALAVKLPEMDLDVLVNNAITGLTEKHFHKLEPAAFLASFRCNVLPAIILTRAAIAAFRKKGGGRIITMLSSYLAARPPAGLSEYLANKAYLESLSRSWAAENAAFNITANCVAPSFVRTGLTEHTDERVVEAIAARQPSNALLTPEEIAETVDFLARCPRQINGVSIVMNGGADGV